MSSIESCVNCKKLLFYFCLRLFFLSFYYFLYCFKMSAVLFLEKYLITILLDYLFEVKVICVNKLSTIFSTNVKHKILNINLSYKLFHKKLVQNKLKLNTTYLFKYVNSFNSKIVKLHIHCNMKHLYCLKL